MSQPASNPIKALLRDQGRSVRWLAKQLGISATSLHDRLSGRRAVGGSRGPQPKAVDEAGLKAAATALGMTPEMLATWVGAASPVESKP